MTEPHLVSIQKTKAGRALLWGNQIKNIPPPEPLVETDKGFLDLDTIGMIYGPWGHYKSFLATHLALCVSTGHPFYGHKVHQGNVLYVVGEGYTGTGVRLDAWQEHNGVTLDPPIAWLEGVPHLITDRSELLEVVHEVKPVLTLVDTLARGMVGAAENDSVTMGKVIETLDEVRQINHSCAVGIHHSGRGTYDASGNQHTIHARGHSILDAGLDSVLRMNNKELYIEKQKHHEDHYSFGSFNITPVRDSIVLEMQAVKSTLTTNQERILAALRGLGGESNNTDLKKAAAARGVPPDSFDYALKRLVTEGLAVRFASVGSKPAYRLP